MSFCCIWHKFIITQYLTIFCTTGIIIIMICITVHDIAKAYNCSKRTAYYHSDDFPKIKIGRLVRIITLDFDTLNAIYDSRDLARLFLVSERTIARLTSKNKLRFFIAENKKYFLKNDIIRFLINAQI